MFHKTYAKSWLPKKLKTLIGYRKAKDIKKIDSPRN